MQTLQAGSFLKLENDGSLEALKFTARLLAEHTEKVVKETLNNGSLENLANNLWQKAEYVTREMERRKFQQIFVENFTERFRELKPDFDNLTLAIADSFNREHTPEKAEDKNEQIFIRENTSPTEQTSEAHAQKDEFLGLVKNDEFLIKSAAEEREAVITEEIKQTTEAETKTEVVKSVNEGGTAETSISESSQVSEETETIKENNKTDKVQTTAQNNSRTENLVKSGTAVSEAKEPFEFGKCTVSLNLTLLPCFGNEGRRKAIISAVSHALTPEIEYIEITEGEDLEQIAALVKDKLSRFRGTLPVKYIEQLRAAKTKATKTNQTAKSASSTSLSTEKSVGDGEKTSGEQKMLSAAHSQSEVKSDEQMAEKESETVSLVPPPTTTNERVQPSLF
jgi:hypothetical protein